MRKVGGFEFAGTDPEFTGYSAEVEVADPEALRPGRHYTAMGKVGRENVIVGTDCGLGGRVHPQIAWAKLRSLAEGARMASRQLWRSSAA